MIAFAPHVTGPEATLDGLQASRQPWECLVVGAGPAGAVAARRLAQQGHRTLLVERTKLPRWKACGCCLNHAALAVLDRIGLRDRIERLSTARLRRWHLTTRHGEIDCPMPQGLALSRGRFDAFLVSQALAAGCEFLDDATALVLRRTAQGWRVALRTEGDTVEVQTQVLVAADGLKSGLLSRLDGFDSRVLDNAWIGAAATVSAAGGACEGLASDTIYMSCGRSGYVGMVVLESQEIEIAAALDPGAIQALGGLEALIGQIVTEAPGPGRTALRQARFRGTPRLSRRRHRLADERLFLIGDACGYTEPFTGEGMAWALASGLLVVPLVTRALQGWDPSLVTQWHACHARQIRRRQRVGRMVTRGLRSGACTAIMTALLRRRPSLAGPFMRRINAPFDLKTDLGEVR